MTVAKELAEQLANAEARKGEVETQLATAREALKRADERFVRSEISLDELTAFQSSVTSLERAVASISSKLDGLKDDYQEAVKAEAMEAFKAEAAEVVALKAKVDERFAKAAVEASAQIETIVAGLVALQREDDQLTDRARSARRRLDLIDKQLGEQAEARHQPAFAPGIRNWANKFTGSLAWPIAQMVGGYRMQRPAPAPARPQGEQAEVAKRLRPSATESEVARRLSAPSATSEAARRLGRVA